MVIAAGLLSLSSVSLAHTGGESHRAIVSVERDAVRALLFMQVPAGRRAEHLIASHDLNHDGRLDSLEGRLLAMRLGDEVVGGWLLTAGTVAPMPSHIAARAAVTDTGAVLVALLLEYPPTRERVSVRIVSSSQARGPVRSRSAMVELQATNGISRSSHAIAKDAPVVGPILLQPGGAAAWIDTRSLAP